MDIRLSRVGDVALVEPEGRIDTTSAHELEAAVGGELKEGTRRFLIDFTAVEYVSSAGLRVLLMLAKKLGGGDGESLVLCSMDRHVREVFDIAGFSSVFCIVPAKPDALKRLTVAEWVLERTQQAVKLLGAKPGARRQAPPSSPAALGCELLTGERVVEAAAPPERAPDGEEISPTEVWGGMSKRVSSWLGRFSKRD